MTDENKSRLQLIAWETVKAFIVVTCMIAIISQVIFIRELIRLQQGQAAIYDIMYEYQQEIRENLLLQDPNDSKTPANGR